MLYCTSDIHNDYKRFKELLCIMKFNPEVDKIIIIGDFVDRGTSPDPYSLINHIRQLERQGAADVIMGNHEKWLAEYIRQRLEGKTKREYYYNTYNILRTVYSNDELTELADWLIQLPLQKRIIYKEKEYLLAHAATSVTSMDESYYLMGDDNFLFNDSATEHVSIVGHNPTPKLHWETGQSEKGAKIWYNKSRTIIDIDSGCSTCSNGCLSGLCLDTMQEFYV